MNIPASILEIINKLENHNFCAYLVGGCVRDWLMGIQPHDYDITTNAMPEQIMAVFSDEKVIPTGLKHGTVTVIYAEKSVEITTFRADIDYKDHRHPERVEFSQSIYDDLKRRDFTINAIAFNPKTGYIDLFDGINDIKSKIIRCVGNADERFNEDALRILRALRFSCQTGFEIENMTAASMLKNKHLLEYVSAERKRDELLKAICTDNFLDPFMLYREIIAKIIPEIEKCFDFKQRSKYHHLDVYSHLLCTMKNISPTPILRLTMLFHDIGKPYVYTNDNGIGHFYGHAKVSCDIALKTMKNLRLDNISINKIMFLIKYHDLPLENTDQFIKRWLNKAGKELYFDLIDVHIADDSGKHQDYRGRIDDYLRLKAKAKEIISRGDCFSLTDLKVNGNDMIDLGFRGKEIGKVLSHLLNLVISNEIENEKEALLNQARKYKK